MRCRNVIAVSSISCPSFKKRQYDLILSFLKRGYFVEIEVHLLVRVGDGQMREDCGFKGLETRGCVDKLELCGGAVQCGGH